MRETIRLSHNEFRDKGPIVDIDVETWYCCRAWPIVVSSTTYSSTDPDAWPKREGWFIRNCGLCGTMPRPRN